MRSVHAVLASAPDPTPLGGSSAWWERHRAVARGEPHAIDQAILGGFAADRLAYAFASGYQAALRALVPDLPWDRLASLAVTERGGGHPRAIETRLDPIGGEGEGGGYLLTGRKRWATLSGDAGVLLVAASISTGADAQGRNRLRVARVDGAAPGVTRRPMPEPPFTPEISHGEVELACVVVAESELLPGDGFDRYVRPFRTVEDVHVHAAVYAYVIREIRLHGLGRPLAERFAGLLVALRALAAEDPAAPEVHVALAGVLSLARAPLEDLDCAWAKTESPAHARWERDRLLFSVAGGVRDARLARAWEKLGGVTA